MTPRSRDDVARATRLALSKLAKARGEDANFVFIRYAMERYLYRLSVSKHNQDFVLKGAILFSVWSGHPHRATKDIDLLGTGAPDPARVAAIFREVSALDTSDDGMTFDPSSVRAERIKEDADYEGVRVVIDARLGSVKSDCRSTSVLVTPSHPRQLTLRSRFFCRTLPSRNSRPTQGRQ